METNRRRKPRSGAELRTRYQEYAQRTVQRTHEVMPFDCWKDTLDDYETDKADGFDDPDDTLERS